MNANMTVDVIGQLDVFFFCNFSGSFRNNDKTTPQAFKDAPQTIIPTRDERDYI